MPVGPKGPLSPLQQELEVGGRRPPYLLVFNIKTYHCTVFYWVYSVKVCQNN